MFKIQLNNIDLGKRLDLIVPKYQPDLGRGFVKKLAKESKIYFDGKPQPSGYKPRHLGTLEIDYDLNELNKIQVIKLPILYEDENILAIDKPAGVITHNRGRYWDEPSVASFIRSHLDKPLPLDDPNSQRAGIVHRLDRGTSGVIICAKNSETKQYLQNLFEEKRIQKTYIAIIEGKPKESSASIDMPIERDKKNPSKFTVGANGKPSRTTYRVIANFDGYSIATVTPLTGRTHQIRVHFKAIGHPIIGDILYSNKPADRLMLHAYSLAIPLTTGKNLELKSNIPKEFIDYGCPEVI